MTDAIYLVFLGTSRQGRATIEALKALGCQHIFATSRNPESASSKALNVEKVLPADYNDPPSILAALQESKATRVWFTTDWYAISRPTREKEFQQGKTVIDAILQCTEQVQHVVYNSVGDANNCDATIGHFWSKADVEDYMKQQLQCTWAILRPVAFFDNLDDPNNYNPLQKGFVKFIGKDNIKFKFIATQDIGKASATMLLHDKDYASQTIEAAGGEHTGTELAAALSEVSGVPCTYKVAVPRFLVWLLMRDLYHMIGWMERVGYSADIEAFKKVVPDAMDAKAWFQAKGQWSNGEKFAASTTE